MKIAAATAVDPMTELGVLYHIGFAVADKRSPATAELVLGHVLFNNGEPVPVVVHGAVKIVGHDGRIRAQLERTPPDLTIEVEVDEVDENRDDQAVETLVVMARSGVDQERLTVTETGVATGVFTGSIVAARAQSLAGDGIIQVEGEGAAALCYIDSLDADGHTIERCAQVQVRSGRDARLRTSVVSQPRDTVWVRLIDGDLNLDPLAAETAVVQGTNTTTGEREDAVLTERSIDDSVFFGSVPTSSGRRRRRDQDGIFWTRRNQELVFTFADESTAQGPAQRRQQVHQVIGRFGDVDGNNRIRSADEQSILLHALGLFELVGVDSLAANVDSEAPFSPITPGDAALVRQRRQRQISRFPVQERTAANHPQAGPTTAKSAGSQRYLSLVDRGGYVVVRADERAGISSGDLYIEGIVGRVETVAEDFVALSRLDGAGLRLVFAGASAASGPGDLVRIYAAERNGRLRLARAELNDGRLGVRLGHTAAVDVLPTAFALHANAPNPFNPETVIRFDLPRDSGVQLEIYDVLGRKVRTLIQKDLPAGVHQAVWAGRDGRGRQVGSGVYFYRLKAGAYIQTRRMILLE